MNLPIDVATIRNMLVELGWTQTELAEAVKVKKRTVEGIMSRGTAALESLHRLATALEMDVNALRRMPATISTAPKPTPEPSPTVVTPPGCLFQLPALLADFVGREDEVHEVVDRLRREGGRIGLSALRGMGGVRKTTVAVHVAHLVKDQFPDAQLFLDLQGLSEPPATTVEVMARFIRDFLGEVPKLPETEAELLPLHRSVYASKRALGRINRFTPPPWPRGNRRRSNVRASSPRRLSWSPRADHAAAELNRMRTATRFGNSQGDRG